ncbi:polyphosphate kinase 1 [Proteocatella sphenisci]|uniref:polyphosphate kinase 1 n=1 Tax=Proteocatella sphenisci TaxID=181070 RepID=UPI00048EFBD5|nr:polyphosphate kinase 1 [Proteocatella sphenisci]
MEKEVAEKSNNKLYTQDREISWLKFNKRVLEEAEDKMAPLLERLKFVSIFMTNLDEFYMIRVGRLNDLNKIKVEVRNDKSNLTPGEQLEAIFEKTQKLIKERDAVYCDIDEQLRKYGIYNLKFNELDKNEKKYIENYFKNRIQPILSPMIIDNQHPFPHLANKQLYVLTTLKGDQGTKGIKVGIIPVPESLPSVIYIEDPESFIKIDEVRFIRIEEIIQGYSQNMFGQYQAEEKTVIAVTRNADLNLNEEIEEDDGEDYRHFMKKLLKKRGRLLPVRLEVMGELSADQTRFMTKKLDITEKQIFQSILPIKLSHAFELAEKISVEKKLLLCDRVFESQYPSSFTKDKKIRITDQIKNKDALLHYPYEQMEPFISLLKESASDPNVLCIKITVYRLALRSKIAEQLCEAAENGKEVHVLMELKARFDEQNNIAWAERLEDAGCNVIYGLEDFKVHSKICLITRNDGGSINYITQVGTGNYNEKTATLYSDYSLMTANTEIGKDANEFFKNMMISNPYGIYNRLWVAPNSLKNNIIIAIDEEINKVKAGKSGMVVMKANSLTERSIMDKLSEASQAGVEINLIIRGICCILPGIDGYTENIQVFSLVGRFLEHHRVYMFGQGDDRKIYISSADLMTRNLTRRVEIACPILDYQLRKKIENTLEVILSDNVKLRQLRKDGNYIRVTGDSGSRINAQEIFIEEARALLTEINSDYIPEGFAPDINEFLRKIRSLFTRKS